MLTAMWQKAETLQEEILVLMTMLDHDCRRARSQDSHGILTYANTHPQNKQNSFPLDPVRTGFQSLTIENLHL